MESKTEIYLSSAAFDRIVWSTMNHLVHRFTSTNKYVHAHMNK